MKGEAIKIAGAGISGLTSAIVLAKAGYKVKIFERNNDVGRRFNEDFQGLMNYGFDEDVLEFMKEIGLEINFWNKPIVDIDLFGPNDYKKNFVSKKPFVYLIQRGNKGKTLDQSLKKQALENGVEIIFNTPVKQNDVDIIATGPNFDGVTDVMAMGYTFESESKDIFAMIFDDKLAFNGYSYFLIADGHGTIATCIFGKYNKLPKYLNKTFDFIKNKFSFDIKNKKKFTGVGNFHLLNSDKKYVGEAGGFQDFLWGFGIRYAMITGDLAAKSIIENRNYKDLWKKEMEHLLKTSIVNRFWFSVFNNYSYKYFIKFFEKTKDPNKLLGKVYNPNVFSKALYPVAKIYFGKYIKDRNSKN
jgi:flavin-dependent dehydrogenase